MTKRTVTVERVVGATAETDRNGVAYVTLTVEDAESGETITLQMDVTQAGAAVTSLSESESTAVENMREAGYHQWPRKFVMPEFPSEEDARWERQ